MSSAWKTLFGAVLLLLVVVVTYVVLNPLEHKNVGGLQVITHDTPSSLFLDGQYLDKTPFIQKTIKPGTYTLRIEPDNPALITHETSVTIRKGLLTVVTWKPGDRPESSGGVMYEMEQVKSVTAELSFVTIPDNAIIRVDQGNQQFSPLIVSDLEPGHHQFEVQLPSYETQKHTINVVKGHRITITVKLAKSAAAETTPPTELTIPSSPAPTPPATSPTTSPPTSPLPTPAASPSVTNVLPATSATPAARRRTAPTSSALPTGPVVTITSTNFFQNGKEVLRIRSQPNSSGTELGFAEVGKSYPYLGVQENGWYQIQFEGKPGWASGQYAKVQP